MAEDSSTASSVRTTDLTGQALGDYRVLRRLGRGGMADVYLAEQRSLRRNVALKVLKPDLATDESYVRRFHLEAQAAAAFVHETVVQIHEVGCVDGVHFIAQEYVQGQNLAELVTRRGPPDARLAVTILRRVAAALHQAAGRGIVHRDIKPENIMLSTDGRVKVADFGLARVARDDAPLNLTRAGMTLGTPLYMSPEQVEGKPLDTRSDLYSLGVTSYYMLAGAPPFAGETALAVAVQHLKTRPRRLEEARPDLPAGLCRIVHKLLEKDPEQRYPTPAALLADLRGLGLDGDDEDETGEDVAVAAAAAKDRGEMTQRLEQVMKTEAALARRRRRWLLVAAAATTAFALAALAARQARGPFLLAGVDPNQTRVARQPTAEEQFHHAEQTLHGSQVGYLAVLEHYPDDPLYAPRAQQRLAMIHLQRNDYAAALARFRELADRSEPEHRAFGLAGEYVVLALEGRHEESVALYDSIWMLRDHISIDLGQLLMHAYSSNAAALGRSEDVDWEQWASEKFGNSAGQ